MLDGRGSIDSSLADDEKTITASLDAEISHEGSSREPLEDVMYAEKRAGCWVMRLNSQ